MLERRISSGIVRLRAARCVVLVQAFICASCASQPIASQSGEVPVVRLPVSQAGIVDGRARFREIFCDIDRAVGRDLADFRECGDALIEVGVEPQPQSRSVHTNNAGSLPVLVFVEGLLGECVRKLASPFSDSYGWLSSQGYQIIVIPVEGRSSSARNSEIINKTLHEKVKANDRLLVIGYSKGVPDFLEALGRHRTESWVSRVEAFVSVAGVVSGTPVADELRGAYDSLVAKLPFPDCPVGDGRALDSLTRSYRQQWLAANTPPKSIRYFSVVAVAKSGHVNPLLVPFHEALTHHDVLNDAQVLAEDAVLPDSHLLGFASADHWAIAMPFDRSDSLEALPLKADNAYPREVLIRAILRYVSEVPPVRR
jgi:hypothetical protein